MSEKTGRLEALYGKKKILVMIMFMLFSIFLIQNISAIVIDVGQPFTASGGTTAIKSGWLITPKTNLYLNNITTNNTVTATIAYIYSANKSTQFTNSTITSNFASFSSNNLLLANTQYYIVVDNASSVYAHRLRTMTLPNSTYADLNITAGVDNTGNPDGFGSNITTSVWEIRAIGYTRAVTTTLNSPANASMQNSVSIVFNATSIAVNPLANATLQIYNSTGLFNQTTVSLGGNINSTAISVAGFAIDAYTWNVLFCDTSNLCDYAPSNFTFNYGAIINSNSYNATTYETASETIVSNITLPSGKTLSNQILYYNGTGNVGTATTSGANYLLTATLDIPANIGLKNLFWSLIYSDGQAENLTVFQQSVAQTNFTLCGAAPQNIPYLNFTYKNETTASESVTAAIASSTFTYYLGSGSVNKNLTYSTGSEASSTAFCLQPQNRSVNVNVAYNYYNSYSIQRLYTTSGSLFTNSTSNVILYLLPTSEGLYTRYKTVDGRGNVVSGVFVVVSKTIGGSSSVITGGYTDSSGQIAFFLDPTDSYDYTFSKTGYATTSFSLTPNSIDTYTVTMGSGVTSVNGSTVALGVAYTILPSNSTLLNNTFYTFSFNLSQGNLTFSSMNLTNASGYQLNFTTGSGIGTLSQGLNTGNMTKIIGYFTYGNAQENNTVTFIWTVGNFYEGDYSLFRQLGLFKEYDFALWWRLLFTIAVMAFIVYGLSYTEVVDTVESKIGVVIFLTWIFAYLGWLDTGFVISQTAGAAQQTLAQFSNQYGIAMLTTGFGGAIIYRRLFT